VEKCGRAGEETGDYNMAHAHSMPVASCKNIDTHSEYVTRISLQLQNLCCERASVVLYTYIACCFFDFCFIHETEFANKT
jgi:hypothetical protein